MGIKPLHRLFEDLADSVLARTKAGDFPARASQPSCGSTPSKMLSDFSTTLVKRRCFARRLGIKLPDDFVDEASETSSESRSSSCSEESAAATTVKKAPNGRKRKVRIKADQGQKCSRFSNGGGRVAK